MFSVSKAICVNELLLAQIMLCLYDSKERALETSSVSECKLSNSVILRTQMKLPARDN